MSASEDLQGISGFLVRFITGIGHVVCYVNGLLVVVIVLQVFLRYGLGRGLVVLEEIEWHLWAIGFLFGLSYCTATDKHIRMDLIYRRFTPRTQAWLNFLSILILVLPFVVVAIWHGADFFYTSWQFGERSRAPLGLPFRWAIKAIIPISFALVGLGALARLIQSFHYIRKG